MNDDPGHELTCPRCSSSELFEADAVDGHVGHRLVLRVHAKPAALLIRGTKRGILRARACGQCGHVELFLSAPDASRLHKAWLKRSR